MTIKTTITTANFSPSRKQNRIVYCSDAEWDGVFAAAADEFCLTDDCITVRTRRCCLFKLCLVWLSANVTPQN